MKTTIYVVGEERSDLVRVGRDLRAARPCAEHAARRVVLGYPDQLVEIKPWPRCAGGAHYRQRADLIESGALAHMVTLNSDGSPPVTCVWVGLDGDEIVSGHLGKWQKVKNVARDPRAPLSLESPHENQLGLREYLVVHGRGRIEEGARLSFSRGLRRCTSGRA